MNCYFYIYSYYYCKFLCVLCNVPQADCHIIEKKGFHLYSSMKLSRNEAFGYCLDNFIKFPWKLERGLPFSTLIFGMS